MLLNRNEGTRSLKTRNELAKKKRLAWICTKGSGLTSLKTEKLHRSRGRPDFSLVAETARRCEPIDAVKRPDLPQGPKTVPAQGRLLTPAAAYDALNASLGETLRGHQTSRPPNDGLRESVVTSACRASWQDAGRRQEESPFCVPFDPSWFSATVCSSFHASVITAIRPLVRINRTTPR
jgi:hypothetical protein